MENKYLKETAMSLNPDGDNETITTDTGGTDDPKTGGGGGSNGGD
ncbi:hypothetical protein [Tenacibaculum discolor]|uniref:Bacteriocin-like protein n=1 Tax=Tenacibaculum discolor TaxID=361581 RepID=A0ABT9EZY5_9FLAO|nr:hypothetical protein [Tenacibaculum discolor]MDP2540014.1 hypothetical protein [Tenacibaculum discolor]